MKKILTLLVMMTLTLAVFAGDKVKAVFTLDHQMSETCEKKIKTNLRYEKGITGIEVSLKNNTITVAYDKDKTNPEQIIQGFKKIGFNAMEVNAGAACGPKKGECCGSGNGGCCGSGGCKHHK